MSSWLKTLIDTAIAVLKAKGWASPNADRNAPSRDGGNSA